MAGPVSVLLVWVPILLVLSSLSPVLAQQDANTDFSGEYVMKGKGYGANDRPYAGTCSLTGNEGVYQVSCFNQDTRHTYVGKGLAQNNTLAILIGDVLRGDHRVIYAGEYLVIYKRRADGVLEGSWAHADSPATGFETLTPK